MPQTRKSQRNLIGKVKETLQPTEILGYKSVYFDFYLESTGNKTKSFKIKNSTGNSSTDNGTEN